jgi:hypothetical protein
MRKGIFSKRVMERIRGKARCEVSSERRFFDDGDQVSGEIGMTSPVA